MTDPPAPADPGTAAAVARLSTAALGVPGLDADPAWRLAAAFLLGYRGHTRRAYFADIRARYGWCTGIDLPPLAARRHHVDRWIAEQLEHPQPGTGRPASAATVTRRLSCLAGLYDYAVVDAGLLDASPVVRVKRPRVSDRSSTTGLTETELIALLGAADADGPRSAALITLLALNGSVPGRPGLRRTRRPPHHPPLRPIKTQPRPARHLRPGQPTRPRN